MSIKYLPILALIAFGCKSTKSELKEIVMPWDRPNLDVGSGVDGVGETLKGQCVVFNDDDLKIPVGGNQKYGVWNLEVIKDRETLEKRLSLSASAKMSYAASGQGSLKAKFSEEQSTNDYNVYALASIQIYSGKKILRNASLHPEAVKMINNSKEEDFRKKCGDEYFKTVEYGGEFMGILEFSTTSTEYKKLIESELKAKGSGGLVKASGKVKFSEALKKCTEQTEVRIRGYQVGGGLPKLSDQMTLDGFLSAADSFIDSFNDKTLSDAAPFRAISEPYTNLMSYPFGANPIEIQGQRELIQEMDILRVRIRRALDNLDFVLLNPSQFKEFDESNLRKDREEYQVALNMIYKAARICFDDIAKCEQPKVSFPAKILPERRNPTETSRHPSCGVEAYKVGTGSVCGEPIYPKKRSVSCPVESYKSKASSACGVQLNKLKSSPACAPIYFEKENLSCSGTDKTVYQYFATTTSTPVVLPGAKRVEFTFLEPSGYDAAYRRVDPSRNCYGGIKGGDAAMTTCRWETVRWRCNTITLNITGAVLSSTCVSKPLLGKCRLAEHGIQGYEACRHHNHGVESYKTCEHSDHGVESYTSCEHPDHGEPIYPACAHESFGVELYKSCEHEIDL